MTRASAKAAAATGGKDKEAIIAEYNQHFQQKEEIEARLKVISIPPPTTAKPKASFGKKSRRRGGGRKSPAMVQVLLATATATEEAPREALIPYTPKIDVHWDFVMKELMWLGADFAGERKRQIASAKKLGSSVMKFHENKEKRRLKQLQVAETNRKKLAAKLGRNVKGWWTKLEKIVAYKQKLSADRERQASMNKQLVKLVQQTEKYTESLNRVSSGDDDENVDGPRKRRRYSMSIEEALAKGAVRRKTKAIDYARMNLAENEFYGESTDGSLSSSDEEYSLSDDELSNDDDETTLETAMAEEMRARALADYSADPEELRKLHEEQEMDIEELLERLQQEDETEHDEMETNSKQENPKNVHFAESTKTATETPSPKPARPSVDPGEDADDDGDASDVEDYRDGLKLANNDDDDDDMEDFQACEPEPDDETTMEAEERLGRDMTYEEEIALLNRENEMSIEELRAMYAGMNETTTSEDETPAATYSADMKALDSKALETESTEEDEINSASDDDDEFQADKNEVDDETTMIAEEKLGRDMTYEEELAMLNRENEMSVEELRAMYAGIYGVTRQKSPSEEEDEEETNAETSATDEESLNDDGDDEFEADKNEVDDETTMIAEEKLGRDMTYEEEIAMLNRENEMSVEELRAMYAGMNDAGGATEEEEDDDENVQNDENDKNAQNEASKPIDHHGNSSDEIVSASDDDGEFQLTGPADVDDETTMIAEEKLGRDMTYEEELAMLNRENEMSVEELRAMYAGMNETEENENDEMDESQSEMEIEDKSKSKGNYTNTDGSKNKRKRGEPAIDSALSDRESKRSRGGRTSESENDGTAAMKALEASALKARETLASRPFLLAPWVKLRKYQQIGLNWLVSLQSRRLNGILADGMYDQVGSDANPLYFLGSHTS